MRLLIDTHTFLWFVWSDSRLSAPALDMIRQPGNELLLSAASAWEMAIKISTSKLTVGQDLGSFLQDQLPKNRIDLLPVEIAHIATVSKLPFHHKDPFDRLLVAQSLAEGLPIVSVDAVLDQYGVVRFW